MHVAIKQVSGSWMQCVGGVTKQPQQTNGSDQSGNQLLGNLCGNKWESVKTVDCRQDFVGEVRKKYPAVGKTDDILKLLIMRFSYCSAYLCQGILYSLPYSCQGN